MLPGVVVLAFTKFQRDLRTFTSSYYYTVRSDDVKVLKSRWNFVKAKTTIPGNNIYTLLITFIAFALFISSKFQTLFFAHKLSYYAWATCGFFAKNPQRITLTCFNAPAVLAASKQPISALHMIWMARAVT